MVGAGNICEFHVAAVKALARCRARRRHRPRSRARAKRTPRSGAPTAFASLDALVDAGANVIHVLTPPSAHAKVALAALERGCHVLIEKPIAEERRGRARIAERRAAEGPRRDASTTRCSTIRRSSARSSGPGRRARRGRLGRHPARLGVPAVRRRPAAAVVSRRRLSVPRHRRALPVSDPGAARPDRGRRGRLASLGGDPNLAFDEWRALVRCQRGLGQFQLTWNVEADAEPADHPRHARACCASICSRCSTASARRRRCRRRPSGSSTRSPTRSSRSIDVPIGVWKFVRKEVSRTRACATSSPTSTARLAAGAAAAVSVEDAAEVVRLGREGRARGRRRSRRSGSRSFTLSADVPIPRHRRVGLARPARSSSGCSPRANACACSCAGSRSTPVDGVEYASATSAIPEAVDRAVQRRRDRDPCGAAMKGGWPEHKGGTVVGTQNVIDACRRHGVKQLVHISSMSVVDWAGSPGDGAGQRGHAARAARRGARRVHARQARGRAGSSSAAATPGCRA